MKINELKCDGCPALSLRDQEGRHLKIKKWEKLRAKAIEEIGKIKLYLLCESIPADRFFYDLDTDYTTDGLRLMMMDELDLETDAEVLRYFRKRGIVLADCAFCPLHELGSKPDKQKAASQCLRNHNLGILEINPAAPIITIFPASKGYLKPIFPEIESRKVAEFSLNKLSGLKAMIEQHAR
jgi:hypothetical protein